MLFVQLWVSEIMLFDRYKSNQQVAKSTQKPAETAYKTNLNTEISNKWTYYLFEVNYAETCHASICNKLLKYIFMFSLFINLDIITVMGAQVQSP